MVYASIQTLLRTPNTPAASDVCIIARTTIFIEGWAAARALDSNPDIGS